jgi:hypothetical protein
MRATVHIARMNVIVCPSDQFPDPGTPDLFNTTN